MTDLEQRFASLQRSIGALLKDTLRTHNAEFAQQVQVVADEVKALSDRVDSLVLAKGDTGERGEKGERGDTGDKGEPGDKGERGDTGDKGDPGEPGAPGDKGDTGERGEKGADGLGLDTPVWQAGIHREGALVQHHVGQHYVAVKDTAAEPGESTDWQRVGTAGFRFAKAYSPDREYQDGDIYAKDFSTYVHTGGRAVLLAARGAKGDRGEKGQDGKPGTHIKAVLPDAKNKGLVLELSDGSLHPVSFAPLFDEMTALAKTAALVEVASLLEARNA